MLNPIYKKTKFFLTIPLLGICLSQTAFAEPMTCSLDIFMNSQYHKKYNGPCNVFINNKYAYGDEKIFIVERLNHNDFLIAKTVGLQIIDRPDYSYISGAFEPNGEDTSLTFTDHAKRYVDKNKTCRVSEKDGFKLCIWK
jgi:hypothetical protein